MSLFNTTTSVVDTLSTIRKLYEMMELKNRVPDGLMPYPEDQQALRTGISIEFRYAHFSDAPL